MKSVPAVKSAYLDQGFCKVSGFLTAEQVSLYNSIVNTFHQSWLTDNANYYQKGVLNSAYLTTCEPPHRINTKQRQALFKLIASDQLVDLIKPIFKLGFRFMNTQLFSPA